VPGVFEHFAKQPRGIQALELPAPEPPQRESVLIFSDALGFCRRIVDAAPEGRVGTKEIVEGCEGLTQEDVRRLVESREGGWDLVIYGYGIDAPKSNAVMNVIEQQNAAVRLYFWLLQEIQRTEVTTTRLAVITRGVFAEDPDQHRKHGIQLITAAPLFGMSNSARLEMEQSIQYIDMEWSPEECRGGAQGLFLRLASEVFRQQTFGHNSVRVLSRGRYVLRRMHSASYEAASREFVMPARGVIAISGGNGALGLVMGNWLLDEAERQSASGFTIKFLSRSAKVSEPSLPLWKKVQAKAARMGIPVEQATCDFGSQQATEEFVKEMQGSLTGFVHSAGVLRDQMLANLSWEKFEEVFDSKHRGALYLHSALERHQNPGLSFLWLFSSISVWGNMGQVNYSGSNAFLDALARHRVARGRPGLAIQWGAWGEVGMASSMTDAMRQRALAGPYPFFSNSEALHGLEVGLRTGLPNFSVLKLNPAVIGEMVRAADTASQCLTRNFEAAEIMPLPALPALERRHVYSALQAVRGPNREEPGRHRLVYEAYTQGFVEEEEREWGEDFRTWSG